MMFFTPSPCANSWLPLMASVEPAPTVPAATLVILLPAALIPVLVKLGPPVMVKPLVSSLLLPAVMLSAVRFLAVATLMSLPLRVISILSPSINLTVSPGATLPAVSALVCRFQPVLATSLTALSWSSVAAWPLTMLFGLKVVLVSPPMVPALPSMRTGLVLPMLMLLPKPSFTPSAVVVLVRLPSPFTLMVSPNANCVLVLPSPNLMPLAMAAVLVAILPVLVATF